MPFYYHRILLLSIDYCNSFLSGSLLTSFQPNHHPADSNLKTNNQTNEQKQKTQLLSQKFLCSKTFNGTHFSPDWVHMPQLIIQGFFMPPALGSLLDHMSDALSLLSPLNFLNALQVFLCGRPRCLQTQVVFCEILNGNLCSVSFLPLNRTLAQCQTSKRAQQIKRGQKFWSFISQVPSTVPGT